MKSSRKLEEQLLGETVFRDPAPFADFNNADFDQVMKMIKNSRARPEWKCFAILPKASRPLALAWWCVLVLRGLLRASVAVAMGFLVDAVGCAATAASLS